jgi:hypothetical protein
MLITSLIGCSCVPVYQCGGGGVADPHSDSAGTCDGARLLALVLLQFTVQRAALVLLPHQQVADEVDRLDAVGEHQHARLGAPVRLAQIRDVLQKLARLPEGPGK